MARWVKCKNRLPELHEDVLMLFDNGNETNMAVGFLVTLTNTLHSGAPIPIAVFIQTATNRLHIGCHCRNCQGGMKMAELKPCPFCGGACGISRKEQSKFTVRQGELLFEQNGYKKLVEMWNRRSRQERISKVGEMI